MPAKSQAQRAYLNMKFGHSWVKQHHFDNKGKLPQHVEHHKFYGAQPKVPQTAEHFSVYGGGK